MNFVRFSPAAAALRLAGNASLARRLLAAAMGLVVAGGLSCAAASAASKQPLPVCSFERPSDLQVVRPSGVEAQRVKEHPTDGAYALKCVFPGNERDTWPGLSWTAPDDLQVSDFDFLALDVFNPSAAPVSLSWRIDDASGRKVFGSHPLPAHAVTTVKIPVRRKTGTKAARRVTHVYPYVRCPRKDVILYVDNIRLTWFALQFTPLVYIDDSPRAKPSPAETQRGCQLFHRHWMEFVFPVSHPRPGETTPALTLTAAAAPGETTPLTLSLFALRPLRGVHARLTPLRTDAGDVLPTAAAEIYVVRCLNKRVTYSSKEYIADLPVYLARQPEVDVPAHRAQRFWADIHVPADARPGVYSGSVHLEAASGMSTVDVPVRLRVWPFRLQETGRILGDYYQTPRPASTEAERRALLETDLRDMRRRGATSVGLCFGCPVKQATLEPGGVVRLNLPDDCLYVRFMNLYRDLKFPAPVVQLSDSGQAFANSRKLKFGTPEYAAAYQGFWKAMQTEARKRGWPEIIVQPVDEPGWKDTETRARNVVLLKLLKQLPGQRTEQDGPGDAYFHNVAGPWADVWNYNGALGTAEQLAAARKDGRLLMIYNCDVESWRPEVDRYVAGFFQERANIDGCYNWCYLSYYGSPYDDLDASTGTWMHVYPKVEGEPGGPSTGWQGFRAGVTDLRYVTTLRRLLRRADAATDPNVRRAAAAATTDLEGILDTLAYHRQQRSTGRWAAKRRDGKRILIRGPYLLPNGWSFPEYDAARRLLAVDLWRLLAALHQAPPLPAGMTRTPGGGAPRIKRASSPAVTPNAAPAGRTVPFVAIPLLRRAPVKLDGRLDDPVWKQAALIPNLVRTENGSPPEVATRVRLAADSTRLLVGFECFEPNVRHLTATVTKDGGAVWKDDCVELFVDPRGGGREFRQVVVNCLGKQSWNASRPSEWRARSQAAAWIGPDRWTAELMVPLADLGVRRGAAFGLNLYRERRPMEAFELLAWSPTGGKFAQPDKFGLAVLGGAEGLLRMTFGPPEVGEHTCRVALGFSQQALTRRLEVTVSSGGTRLRFRSKPRAATHGPTTLVCNYRVPPDAKEITLQARLLTRTPGNEQPEVAFRQTQRIQPVLDAVSVSPALATAGVSREFRADLHASRSLRKRLTVTAAIFRWGRTDVRPLCHASLAAPAAGPLQGRILPRGLPVGAYRLVLRCRAPGVGILEQQRAFVVTPR